MPGISTSKTSIPFSRGGSQSWESYWATRNFRGVGRSGLTIPDEFGNDASILPSCGLCDENNYLKRTVANFASAVSSGYIEVRVYYDGSLATNYIFSSCDIGTASHIFRVFISNAGKPTIQVTEWSANDSMYRTTNALSIGWHIIKFISSGSAYSINVDGSPVDGSMVYGTNDGDWINKVTSRDNITVGVSIYNASGYSNLFYIDYLDFNGTNKWYFSGQGLYEYDILADNNLRWTGTEHIHYGNNISNQFLDVGYDLYTKEGGLNEYIPYVSAGVPPNTTNCMPAWMESVGYIFWGHIAGDAANYNLAPAMIEFPAAITDYDRSNTTIHKAAARAGSDYDVSNPTRWRGIDVCNPDIYYSWKNTGYEAKQFAKIDFILAHPTKAYEFITFPTNASAVIKLSVEAYCNIDDYYDIDVILMGDKTDGVNVANNTIVNNIYVGLNPDLILGTGDYDDSSHTTTQLVTEIASLLKFSAPGNHDDWVTGVRTEFNANFHGGGYKKVSIPNVDFFLYDEYLKLDESGYYTYIEAEAITLAARQASTQGLWLIAQLAASTAKYKIVVMHQPPWESVTFVGGEGRIMEGMQWDWSALGVNLILGGHFHFYERLIKNTGSGNVNIINTGTSGAGQGGWLVIDEGSQYIVYSGSDADFSAGCLIQMNVTRDKLQVDLSGVDTDGNIHMGKDQLILT